MSKNYVIGLIQTHRQAEIVVDRLTESGFPMSSISILLPDDNGTRVLSHEKHSKASEGAAAGVSAGGILGGTLGLLAGIGTLAVPGVGALIAAGPILAALSGIAVGASVGGITGALVGLGIPEYEAKVYEGKVKAGQILISVHTDNNYEKNRAQKILKDCAATDVSVSKEKAVAA